MKRKLRNIHPMNLHQLREDMAKLRVFGNSETPDKKHCCFLAIEDPGDDKKSLLKTTEVMSVSTFHKESAGSIS
jgi:hypothetical protein